MGNKFFRLQRVKQQLKRFIALPFVLFSIGLFVFSTHSKPVILGKVADFSRETFMPLFDLVATPFEYMQVKIQSYQNYLNVYAENERLRKENQSLKGWQNKALQLMIEQKELSSLVNYQQNNSVHSQVVRVLGEHNSVFSHSLVLDAGLNQGVKKGSVLLLNNALFGHVIEVGDKTARALKLTDYFSRLPVFVGSMKESAILIGDNSDEPELTALQEETQIKDGDFVFSAGQVGVYPQGLPIGFVKKSVTGYKVQLLENKNNLGFVQVVDFALGGLIETACQQKEE